MADLAWAVQGLPAFLASDLTRVASHLSPDNGSNPYALGALAVLRCHYLVAEHFSALGHGLSQPGVKNLHLLQSAVYRQHVGFGGVRKWTDLLDVTATLFFGLVKNHAFHDANKRTALLACFYQLQYHRRMPDAEQVEFETLAERVAADELTRYPLFRKVAKNDDAEVRFISEFLRSRTRREDKKEYRVSYRQLDAILRRYGFELGGAHDNKIHVYRRVVRAVGLLRRREQTILEPVTQVGFRDWGTEVSGKDMRHVRRMTKLSLEQGIDSAMFFQGVDPIESLVAQYSDLLKRLSTK